VTKNRKMLRAMKRKPPPRPASDLRTTSGAKGFDLREAQLTDLDSIHLDAEANEIEVTLSVPVGDGEDFSTYEQTFDLEDDSTTPDTVRGAARVLAGALVRAIRERTMMQGELPCTTCSAPCCARAFDRVELTQQDVERMEAGGVDVSEDVIDHYAQESWTGHVGAFRRVDWFGDDSDEDEDGDEDGEGKEQCCPHLTPEGCGIYEHRPLVCREFSAWTCELYEEDPDKVDGKVRLRVVNESKITAPMPAPILSRPPAEPIVVEGSLDRDEP
jgi:Fe-S-cluster containining protein